MKKMDRKIPKFKNEDEERVFWSTHSPLDYFNVDNAYPVRIVDMTKAAKSEKIRQFDLSSFMMGPPLAEVLEKIDRSMTFFSIYIVMENLEENLWEQSRYVDKERVYLCSLVEEEIRRYWWDRNREHLERIDDLMESYRNDSIHSKMTEGELMDKAIEKLNKEVYPLAIQIVKDQYQEIYEDEWEAYWKTEDPFKERTEYRYHRRYDMPPPFNHWDSRNSWQQYYCAKTQDGIFYYSKGGSGSSGQRYNHGFYGHLFALINRENSVPTYFFIYDSRNHFVCNREEKNLWLNFFNLIGNFKIDREKSEKILDGVSRISAN